MSTLITDLDTVKTVDDLRGSHHKAIVNKLGGIENVIKLLRDQVRVDLVDIVTRFDKWGRRIPPKGLQYICDSTLGRDCSGPLNPLMAFLKALERLGGSRAIQSTGQDLYGRVGELAKQIVSDPRLQAVHFNGVCFPIVIPEYRVKYRSSQYGELLRCDWFPKLEKEFSGQNGKHEFVFDIVDPEAFNTAFEIVSDEAMQLFEVSRSHDIPAWYFPFALSGYSVHAAREQMTELRKVTRDLPNTFALANAMETIIATIMYPEMSDMMCTADGNSSVWINMPALERTEYKSEIALSMYSWSVLSFDSGGSIKDKEANSTCGLIYFEDPDKK